MHIGSFTFMFPSPKSGMVDSDSSASAAWLKNVLKQNSDEIHTHNQKQHTLFSNNNNNNNYKIDDDNNNNNRGFVLNLLGAYFTNVAEEI